MKKILFFLSFALLVNLGLSSCGSNDADSQSEQKTSSKSSKKKSKSSQKEDVATKESYGDDSEMSCEEQWEAAWDEVTRKIQNGKIEGYEE